MQVLFCYEVFKSTFKHVESSALAQTLKFNINPHYRPRQSWPVTVATQCMLHLQARYGISGFLGFLTWWRVSSHSLHASIILLYSQVTGYDSYVYETRKIIISHSIFKIYRCSTKNATLTLHHVRNPRKPEIPYLACKPAACIAWPQWRARIAAACNGDLY